MVPAKETAEEQLLRMIEGPAGPKRSEDPKGSALGKRFDRFKHQWDDFRHRLITPRRRRDHADTFLWQLQMAGRLFWVLLGALGVYIVVDLWLLQPQPPVLFLPGTQTQQPVDGSVSRLGIEEDLKESAEAYRRTLASRNPFRLAKERIVETGEPAGPTAKNKLLELTSTLVVVGINRGRVPEALIEDTEAKRTHFVKVGDQINGVTIKDINDTGVVVSYEGEETFLQ